MSNHGRISGISGCEPEAALRLASGPLSRGQRRVMLAAQGPIEICVLQSRQSLNHIPTVDPEMALSLNFSPSNKWPKINPTTDTGTQLEICLPESSRQTC